VIELQVVIDHFGESRQIAGVVGVKNLQIERFDLVVDGTTGIEAIGNGLSTAAKA
jgi:hypothetical protein